MSRKPMQRAKNEPKPTFDFSRVGRNFTKGWQEVLSRATAVSKIMVNLMPEDNSRESLEEFEALHAEYHEKLVALGDEQR